MRRRIWSLVATLAMLAVMLAIPTSAGAGHQGFLTDEDPMITLQVPGAVKAIINSGETLGDFMFEGIPDGIGIRPGPHRNTIDVYVSHEQSRVPFRDQADFEDGSVSKLTLSTSPGNRGAVLSAEVAIPASAGFIRFCSAFMAGPAEGFSTYTYFANEESNDIIEVPADAPYGADPALAPERQAGYAVALNTSTGHFEEIAGMGRHNHENTIVVPGPWRGHAILSTDDTFNAPSSQLYMYLARNERAVWDDTGSLWAFRATHKNGSAVDTGDAFNDANDYLDIQPGDTMRGEFIRVPEDVAKGLTDEAPQDALENWSNDHNVFQFIRLEDLAYDRHDPKIVYIADTGASRVVPDDETGRLLRGPSGTVGSADNGRVFKMVFNRHDPRVVDSLTVMAQGDDPDAAAYVPFRAPDNMDTSRRSLMLQEDADDALIWQLSFATGTWRVVASVNDPDGESSGIVDASQWYGPGSWLLDVQAHGSNHAEEEVDTDGDGETDLLLKREDGQLMLMKIPGS